MKLLGSILLLAVTFGGISSAYAANIRCNNCSEIGYETRAKASGYGDHYVFDFPLGNLRRYFVECRSATPSAVGGAADGRAQDTKDVLRAPAAAMACGIGTTLQAEPIANDPMIVQGFLDLKWFWDETGGTMAKLIEVDFGNLPGAQGGGSAYDVVENFNFRRNLGTLLAARANQLWRLSFVASAANAFRGFTDGIKLVIVVKFPDGTSSTYKLEFPSDRALYDIDSSSTPDGQAIPEANAPNYAGTWVTDAWNAAAFENFFRHLQQLGIAVTRGGGRRLRCTWDGHTLRCV